jgi:hypothetical protein
LIKKIDIDGLLSIQEEIIILINLKIRKENILFFQLIKNRRRRIWNLLDLKKKTLFIIF